MNSMDKTHAAMRSMKITFHPKFWETQPNRVFARRKVPKK